MEQNEYEGQCTEKKNNGIMLDIKRCPVVKNEGNISSLGRKEDK